ncbi:MAG: ATP-binding protein [Acidimicrobiales bacterium]|nr:ATP-binding protein [Acidimicrobiales bacterium]
MSGRLYDPVANPYAPGAGTPPPSLVGRDQLMRDGETSIRRLRSSRSTQHLMLSGLRGVGKTVLLAKLSAIAEREGFRVIRVEAVGGEDTLRSFLRQARRIMEELDSGPRVTRAIRSIDAVSLSLAGAGLTVGRSPQMPDPEALADVVVDLASAAAAHDLGVMLAIDEAQMIAADDLRRIVAGVHRCGQEGLPLWCVLAGLPNVVGIVSKAATYAERLFTVGHLGPLAPDDVVDAVMEPAKEIGVDWAAEATEEIIDRSDGFPFFVQMWAYHTWNAAQDDPISKADVQRASPQVQLALDAAFFTSRIARIPESEIAYVQALASLGPGPHRSGEVATAAGRTSSGVSALRDRLINEGVVYAPRYGWVEFAIPHFDDYVRRTLPASG